MFNTGHFNWGIQYIIIELKEFCRHFLGGMLNGILRESPSVENGASFSFDDTMEQQTIVIVSLDCFIEVDWPTENSLFVVQLY